jgi:hypothetical protein
MLTLLVVNDFSRNFKPQFELSRHTQQPSLTFTLVGGSTFGLWPLFHLRYGGKWTEMTATQHGGTQETLISSLHHYKNYAGFFSLFVFFKKELLLFLSF